MIQAIKPVAREADNSFRHWDKQEDEVFAQKLANARRRMPDMPEIPLASNASFENPAFNILTGNTNYAIRDMASDRRSEVSQMELFERRAKQPKA